MRANVGVMRRGSSKRSSRIIDFEYRLKKSENIQLIRIAKDEHHIYNKNAIKASKRILKERDINWNYS